MRVTLTTITFCATLLAGEFALGAVVEYRDADRDEWFTDVGGGANVSTVNFTGYPDFTPVTDQWAHLGVHFSGFVVTGGQSFFFYPNDGWGARGEPEINVSFDEPIRWIAADYPGELSFQLFSNDQLIHTFHSPQIGGAGRFAGLLSDQSFDRVRIFREKDDLVFLDDLFFGPPIPAPASICMILVSITIPRRRRR